MKKTIVLLLAISIIMALAGCGAVSKQLPAPDGVRIEDGLMKWNNVDGANAYVIVCDGNDITSTANLFYELDLLNLTEGSHSLSVKARGDGYINMSSSNSLSVTFEQGARQSSDTNTNTDTNSDSNTNTSPAVVESITDDFIANQLFSSGLGYGVNALTAKSAIGGARLGTFFDSSLFTVSNLGSYDIGSSRSKAISKEDIKSEISSFNSKMIYGSASEASLAGMFTAGFEEKFSLDTASRSDRLVNQFYFILNLYIIGKNYQMKDYQIQQAYCDKLSQYALNDILALRNGTLSPDAFFDRYGTHLTMAVSYGGMTEVYYAKFSKNRIDNSSISVSLEKKLNAGFSYDALSASKSSNLGVDMQNEFMADENDTSKNLYINSIGKKPSTALTFDGFSSYYNTWVEQFNDESSYRIVDVADNGLVPIWTYFPPEYSDVANILSQRFYQRATELGNALADKMTYTAVEDKGDTVNFAGGHGTEDSPYLISTNDHFVYMLNNSEKDKYYRLINDIDLEDWSNNGIYNWSANKSNAPKSFKGRFDGGDYTIKYSIRIGKTTNITWSLGLFPCIQSAEIKNLNTECAITTYDPKNRKMKWDISNDDRACDVMVGGIVGYANDSTIQNCSVKGSIRYNSDGGTNDTSVGGVVGFAKNCALICDCYSSATIYVRGCFIELGGVIGLVYNSTYSNLTFEGSRSSNEDWAFTGGTWSNDLVGRTGLDILPQ